MGLLTQMLDKSMNTLADDGGPWRQFILDHLDYITKRTVPSNIEILAMNQYRYDLPRFLKERLSRQADISWIVLLLNNLASDMSFVEPGLYIIPDEDLIYNLYSSFVTIEKNRF